jgi:hypothetical protein
MMSDVMKQQQGIEAALTDQAKKNKKARAHEWGGMLDLKARIDAAIDAGAKSIYASRDDYKEPNLSEIEGAILIERAWGSEEFSMDYEEPHNSLNNFQIMLRYPGQRNPRGAGRKKTGHRLDVSLSGLSDKALARLQDEASRSNRSAYIVSLIEKDLAIVSKK